MEKERDLIEGELYKVFYQKNKLEAKVIYLGNKAECVNYHKNMKVVNQAEVENCHKKIKTTAAIDASPSVNEENQLDSLACMKSTDQKAVLIKKLEQMQQCLDEKSSLLSRKDIENAELIEANKILRETFSKFF